MGKSTLAAEPIDRDKTGHDVRNAVSEVRHAVKRRGSSMKDSLSMLTALTAGAVVAWRGFQAARTPERLTVEDLPALPSSRGRDKSAPADGKAASAKSDSKAAVKSAAEPKKATGFVPWVKELVARFTGDECVTRAQALAFVGIMSLIPILLFAIAALGFFVPPEKAVEYVHTLVAQILPGGQAATAADEVIKQAGVVQSAQDIMRARGWALLAGFISLIWAGLGLVLSAADPINTAWEVKETRGFVKLRLVGLAVFFGAGLLFLLSLLPSSGPSFMQTLHIPSLGLPKHPPFLIATAIQIGFELLAWAIDIAMFVLIYKFLPNTKVTWRAAAFGGVIVGLLWELFKKGFAVYLAHFGNFNKLYGALGGLILLVTWILYSCMLLLAGAILCKMYHEHHEEGGVAKKASS